MRVGDEPVKSSRRWRRAACSSGIAAASRMRGLRPHHCRRRGPHGALPGGAGGDPVRRGVVDRKTTETRSGCARARGPRPLRGDDGNPVPRSHAGTVRAARRVRPTIEARATRRRSAPHGRGPRHRARRGGVPGARHRRGINRAGYFVMPMDETLAVAAIDLGGRPHAAVDLKLRVGRSAISRPSWCTISSRGSRSARARTFTSRSSTADRATITSKRCSRRSRVPCGSRARRTDSWQGAAEHEGIDLSAFTGRSGDTRSPDRYVHIREVMRSRRHVLRIVTFTGSPGDQGDWDSGCWFHRDITSPWRRSIHQTHSGDRVDGAALHGVSVSRWFSPVRIQGFGFWRARHLAP